MISTNFVILIYSGAPDTSHVSTAAATIVLSIDESAKTILRDVARSENLGGRVLTWELKTRAKGREVRAGPKAGGQGAYASPASLLPTYLYTTDFT